MENILFVFIAWCTGLVLGFTVPSSTTQAIGEEKFTLENYIPEDNLKSSILDEGFLKSLEEKVAIIENTGLQESKIDNLLLFEHGTQKENHLQERAFVYLQQKFKSPKQKQIFDYFSRKVNEPSKKILHSDLSMLRFLHLSENPMRYASFLDPSLIEFMGSDSKPSQFYDSIVTNEVVETGNKYDLNVNVDELNKQRHHLELLKQPLIVTNYPNSLDVAQSNKFTTDSHYSESSLNNQNSSKTNKDLKDDDKLNFNNIIKGNNVINRHDYWRHYTPVTYRPRQPFDIFRSNFIEKYSTLEHENKIANTKQMNNTQIDNVFNENNSKHKKPGCKCNHEHKDIINKADSCKDRMERDNKQTTKSSIKRFFTVKSSKLDNGTLPKFNIDEQLMNTINLLNKTLQMYV